LIGGNERLEDLVVELALKVALPTELPPERRTPPVWGQ
jgi:hypothetical protein